MLIFGWWCAEAAGRAALAGFAALADAELATPMPIPAAATATATPAAASLIRLVENITPLLLRGRITGAA
jgi:hypothetical protein